MHGKLISLLETCLSICRFPHLTPLFWLLYGVEWLSKRLFRVKMGTVWNTRSICWLFSYFFSYYQSWLDSQIGNRDSPYCFCMFYPCAYGFSLAALVSSPSPKILMSIGASKLALGVSLRVNDVWWTGVQGVFWAFIPWGGSSQENPGAPAVGEQLGWRWGADQVFKP